MYSNPNDRFRRVRTELVPSSARLAEQSNELNRFIVEQDVRQDEAEREDAVQTHFGRRDVLELLRFNTLMRERPDKRRRPNRISKPTFKLFRALKLK